MGKYLICMCHILWPIGVGNLTHAQGLDGALLSVDVPGEGIQTRVLSFFRTARELHSLPDMLAGGLDLGGGVVPDDRLVGPRVQQGYELNSVYNYLHDGAEYILPVHRGAGEVDDGWLLGLMEVFVVRFTAGSLPVLDRARHPLAGAVSPDMSPT